MKNLIILSILCFWGITLHAENFRSETVTIGVGGCLVYHTTFWGDNNTDNVNDDRYLGFHDVMDCGNKSCMVPEELHTFYSYPDGPSGDVIVNIPPDANWITFKEYQKRFLAEQRAIGKIIATEVSNDDEPYQIIQLEEIKNE
ncbi:MAG: hypothetical protein M3R25_12380 [Bacteroidota bacterium]|nr:hypothetical protein [Bacteroidota bacterium]